MKKMHVKQNSASCTWVFDQLPAWSLKAFDFTSAGRCESNYAVSIIYLCIYHLSSNFSAICCLVLLD